MVRAAAQKPRVLVVDDDRDTADSTHFILTNMGFPAQVAYDGSTALELARAHAPQIVLLDLAMPHGNGLELARELRRLPETSRALLVCISGFGTDEDRRLSHEAGCDHHLLKPFDWFELLRVMEQVETG